MRKIGKKQFVTKNEAMTRKRVGKREYLNDLDSKELMKKIGEFFGAIEKLKREIFQIKKDVEDIINEGRIDENEIFDPEDSINLDEIEEDIKSEIEK